METIDLTPTWEAILPTLLIVLQDGNKEGQKQVKEEFRRMAQAADRWNEHLKNMKDKIAIIWSAADVIDTGRKMGYSITEPQAIQILVNVERKHDAEYGVSWESLKYWINELEDKAPFSTTDKLKLFISEWKEGFQFEDVDDFEDVVRSLQAMNDTERKQIISNNDFEKLIEQAENDGII